MQSLRRRLLLTPSPLCRLSSLSSSSPSQTLPPSIRTRALSSSSTGNDEWNDAWESAWLPENVSGRSRAPWEIDVNFPSSGTNVVLPSDVDPDTKAFVEEMDERWNERRRGASAAARGFHPPPPPQQQHEPQQQPVGHSVEQVAGGKSRRADDDYRLRKQRIHAGLWMKEIDKMEEAKLGNTRDGAGDIDRLLDSCSEIFDSGNFELNESKIRSTSEFKTKPDGWETTSKTRDGNIWEITQREEDILLQEFERRIAYSKFQIASFIKSHIFSRRRPIDGWKYMIEEFGPNAKRGKGSVQRLPTLADPSTRPFKEENAAVRPNLASFKGR